MKQMPLLVLVVLVLLIRTMRSVLNETLQTQRRGR
jgi:hypothetical protein